MDIEKKILDIEQTIAVAQKELQELKKLNCPIYPQVFKDKDWVYIESPVCGDIIHCYIFRIKLSYTSDVHGTYDCYGRSLKDNQVQEEFFYINTDNFTNFKNDISRLELKDGKKYRLATQEEVKKALFKIAEHKGFINGVKYKSIIPTEGPYRINHIPQEINHISYRYSDCKHYMYCCEKDGFFYADGLWAEIIKEQEPKDGNWYRVKLHNEYYIIKYKYINGEKGGAYLGANNAGRKGYVENDDLLFYFGKNKNLEVATDDEIKKTLFNIAAQKGFITGSKFKPVCFSGAREFENPITKLKNIGFDPVEYNLYMAGTGYIYNNQENKWAELIKEFEIVPGYPVTYLASEYCVINNMQYRRCDIINLINGFEGINCNGKQNVIHSLNVGCNSQYKLTIQNLKDLIANWPN